MSERELLLRWLTVAAGRLRVNHWLRELGWLGCGLSALLALRELLRLLVGVPAVLAAFVPLLTLSAIALALLSAWRIHVHPSLAQAASAADRRADLKDELRSAHWFVEKAVQGPAVDSFLLRAGATAERLDPRELFPIELPTSVVAAFALAILAIWLVSLASPLPDADQPTSVAGQPRAHSPAPRLAASNRQSDSSPEPTAPAAGAEKEHDRWAEVEKLAQRLRPDEETDAIRRAVTARDARGLQHLVQAAEASGASAGAAQPQGEQMSAEVAEGILERLKQMLDEPGVERAEGQADNAPQPTAQLTQQLREEISEAQRKQPGRHSEGETALNTLLRAISRNSIGERQAVQGRGEAAQDGGRSSVGGGAMGRRVGVSQAGAGEGDRPQGNPAGDAPADPVLGARTARLESQLRQVRVERTEPDDADGSEESFYAATQAQVSQLGYEAVSARALSGAEHAVAGERTPPAFKDAVKRYTLGQHQKEK